MSAEWKLVCADPEINDTFANLHISGANINFESCAPDVLRFSWEPDDGMLAATLVPFNAVVSVTRDDQQYFKGRCRSIPRAGAGPVESIRYEIVGPWFDLERITYKQRWKVWDPAEEQVEWQRKARLILGQAENGTAMTAGQIIQDVVDYAASQGAMIAAATAGNLPSIKIPWEEVVNLKCSDVLIRLLAFVPDYKLRFDYSTTHPAMQIIQRSSATAISLTLGTDNLTSMDIRPRHDLATPGVTVNFERTHQADEQTWEDIETQTAGDTATLDAIDVTLQLAGTNLRSQSVRIESEALPQASDPPETNWLNKPWWIKQVPALAKFAEADLTLIECSQTVEPPPGGGDPEDIEDLPRLLLAGQVPEWLGGAAVARVTLTLKCNYVERRFVDGVRVAERRNHELRHQVTLTNVKSGLYVRAEGDYAEPAPEGFATALYASWSHLQHEGQVAIEDEECDTLARPGDILNLTGGLAAWASMGAHIQQVSEDLDRGTTHIIVGPAKRIDPATLLSLMRRLRARQIPLNHLSRLSGNAGDRAGNVENGGLGPQENTTHSEGSYSHLCISDDYDSKDAPQYTKEIALDLDAIAPSDAEERTDPVVIRPREIRVAVMSSDTEGSIQRVQLLASDAYDQPGDASTPAAAGFMLVPKPSGAHPGILAYHPGGGLVWVYSGTARQPLQRSTGNTLHFDWVRGVSI